LLDDTAVMATAMAATHRAPKTQGSKSRSLLMRPLSSAALGDEMNNRHLWAHRKPYDGWRQYF
jgi:hypothetical protein